MEKVSNFVNGKVAEARDGETTPLVDPCTGAEYGAAARSAPADVGDAVAAASAAFAGWAAATPSDRGRALLRIADAIEADAGRFIDAECRSTGKPKALMAADEIPPMVDQLRFFAGAARMLEGRRGGIHDRPHVLRPPGADRRVRADQPVELPVDDGGVEDRARVGGREHGGAQAGRDDARDVESCSPSSRRSSCRRAC